MAMVGANFTAENSTRIAVFSAGVFWYRDWENEDSSVGTSHLGETLRKACVALDDFEDGGHESKRVT